MHLTIEIPGEDEPVGRDAQALADGIEEIELLLASGHTPKNPAALLSVIRLAALGLSVATACQSSSLRVDCASDRSQSA